MTEFLIHLAALSAGGGAVILLLLLLRRLTRRRYSARWMCWAWLLLALRLAVPFQLPQLSQAQAPIQLTLPDAPTIYEYTPPSPSATISTWPEGLEGAAASPEPSRSPSPSVSSVPQPAGFSLSLSQIFTALWLIGVLSLLIWNLFCHLRFRRWLRRWAVPVTEEEAVLQFNRLGDRLGLCHRPRLLRCPGLKAPMLAGLLRPVLLLPDPIPEGQALIFALQHELIHFRRRDIWLKALVLWVNALHWFNPLIWLMARAVERDTELACDDAVLRLLSPEQRPLYSHAILDTAIQAGKEHKR